MQGQIKAANHHVTAVGMCIKVSKTKDERMLAVFDSIRRILHMRRIDCVPPVGLRRTLALQVYLYRLRWFGHTARRLDGELTEDLHLSTSTSIRTSSFRLRTTEKGLGESLYWACTGPLSLGCLFLMWSTRSVMPDQPVRKIACAYISPTTKVQATALWEPNELVWRSLLPQITNENLPLRVLPLSVSQEHRQEWDEDGGETVRTLTLNRKTLYYYVYQLVSM